MTNIKERQTTTRNKLAKDIILDTKLSVDHWIQRLLFMSSPSPAQSVPLSFNMTDFISKTGNVRRLPA